MSNEIHLFTYCLILILQLISAVSNTFILTLFYRISGLSSNKHLRLILYLTISDFLFTICELPYTIYITANWNPYVFNFDPRFMLISSIPLPAQLKISAILTISIALNRNIALIYPGVYLRINQQNYANVTAVIAVAFAVFDVILCFTFSDYEPKPGCGSAGCFVGDEFRYYWGISNTILGFIIVLLSFTIFLKLNHQKNSVLRKSSNDARFRQANRISIGILVSSLIFLTTPSIFVGVFEICGFSAFKLVGPFYAASLLFSGICNATIFIANNGDARRIMTKKTTTSFFYNNNNNNNTNLNT